MNRFLATTAIFSSLLAGSPSQLTAAAQNSPETTQTTADQLPRWRDWPNWRGPFCNGSTQDCGQPLVDHFSKATLLWTSEEETIGSMARHQVGAPTWQFATFAIVDRRLYFTYNQRRGQPTAVSLNIARISHEGKGMGKKTPFNDLPAENQANLAAVRGDDIYMCLDAVTGRTLWKVAHHDSMNAGVFCRRSVYHPHNVPCWGDGRIFGHGATMRIYAMDAATGEPLWESDAGNAAWKLNYQLVDINENERATSSFGRWGGDGIQFTNSMVVAGTAVIGSVNDRWHKKAASAVTALDIRTGRRLWTIRDGHLGHFNSPVRWSAPDGKEYIILVGNQKASCLDPETGKTMWHIQGGPLPGGGSTPAVTANHLLVQGTFKKDGAIMGGLAVYRITPDKAELLWEQIKVKGGGDIPSPAIYGNVGIFGRSFDLLTGETKGPSLGFIRAPAVADGYLFGKGGMIALDGKTKVALMNQPSPACIEYGEPSVVLGRYFVRGQKRWMCYDMRQDQSIEDRYSKPVAKAYTIESTHEATKTLGSAHWTERQAAIKQLAKDEHSKPAALARLIIEAPYPVAKSACAALCQMGDRARSQAAVLAAAQASCIENGGYGRVKLIATAINSLNPAAHTESIPAIVPLLAAADDLTTYRACRAIELMGKHGVAAVPSLIKLLASEDIYLFRNAALALAGIGPAAGQVASTALASHITSTKPEILVHALVGLQAVGGDLNQKTLDTLMTYAFAPNAQALTVAPFTDFIGSKQFLECAPHYVSHLASKCLSAGNPDQVLPMVLASLEKVFTPDGKGRLGKAHIMHYAIPGRMAAKARSALPMLKKALPLWNPRDGRHRDIGFFWLDRIEAGAGTTLKAELEAAAKKK